MGKKSKENEVTFTYCERKRWLFLGIPWTFTVYKMNEEYIIIDTGFLNTIENDCYMYKVQDVTLKRSFFERIVGLGTIVCNTGDTTHPILELKHIKNSMEIKTYISKVSEEARLKRRTVNTLNIGADNIDDMMDGD